MNEQKQIRSVLSVTQQSITEFLRYLKKAVELAILKRQFDVASEMEKQMMRVQENPSKYTIITIQEGSEQDFADLLKDNNLAHIYVNSDFLSDYNGSWIISIEDMMILEAKYPEILHIIKNQVEKTREQEEDQEEQTQREEYETASTKEEAFEETENEEKKESEKVEEDEDDEVALEEDEDEFNKKDKSKKMASLAGEESQSMQESGYENTSDSVPDFQVVSNEVIVHSENVVEQNIDSAPEQNNTFITTDFAQDVPTEYGSYINNTVDQTTPFSYQSDAAFANNKGEEHESLSGGYTLEFLADIAAFPVPENQSKPDYVQSESSVKYEKSQDPSSSDFSKEVEPVIAQVFHDTDGVEYKPVETSENYNVMQPSVYDDMINQTQDKTRPFQVLCKLKKLI